MTDKRMLIMETKKRRNNNNVEIIIFLNFEFFFTFGDCPFDYTAWS